MQFLHAKFSQLLHNDAVRRVFHTFWQAASGVLVAGLLASRSSADVKLALSAGLAVGFAALKAAYLNQKG